MGKCKVKKQKNDRNEHADLSYKTKEGSFEQGMC